MSQSSAVVVVYSDRESSDTEEEVKHDDESLEAYEPYMDTKDTAAIRRSSPRKARKGLPKSRTSYREVPSDDDEDYEDESEKCPVSKKPKLGAKKEKKNIIEDDEDETIPPQLNIEPDTEDVDETRIIGRPGPMGDFGPVGDRLMNIRKVPTIAVYMSKLYPGRTFEFNTHRANKDGTERLRCTQCALYNSERQRAGLPKLPLPGALVHNDRWITDPDRPFTPHFCLEAPSGRNLTAAEMLAKQHYRQSIADLTDAMTQTPKDAYILAVEKLREKFAHNQPLLDEVMRAFPSYADSKRTWSRRHRSALMKFETPEQRLQRIKEQKVKIKTPHHEQLKKRMKRQKNETPAIDHTKSHFTLESFSSPQQDTSALHWSGGVHSSAGTSVAVVPATTSSGTDNTVWTPSPAVWTPSPAIVPILPTKQRVSRALNGQPRPPSDTASATKPASSKSKSASGTEKTPKRPTMVQNADDDDEEEVDYERLCISLMQENKKLKAEMKTIKKELSEKSRELTEKCELIEIYEHENQRQQRLQQEQHQQQHQQQQHQQQVVNHQILMPQPHMLTPSSIWG